MIHEAWAQYLREAGENAAEPPGLAQLPALAAVRFEGVDVGRFLQGYLTCDLDALHTGRLTPTALCNLKGRVVMNGWCAPDDADEHAVVLFLHDSLVNRLGDFLAPYLRFSRTRFLDQRADTLVFGSLDQDTGDGLVMDTRRRLHLCRDLPSAQALWTRYPHMSASAWEASLVADRVPLVRAETSETFLPQMLDLQTLGAINFEKGCYLGQEVVARAQHRGQVKRRLTRLEWHGGRPPDPGSDITDADGNPRGQVLQTAADGSGMLLAVLARDAPAELQQGDARLSLTP